MGYDASREGYTVNLCYCDESGTAKEPIATMVGIVVDASRMHLTKEHWAELLDELSGIVRRQIVELKTASFYRGSGVWYGMDGTMRADVVSAIFRWLTERKHRVVYTSLLKSHYNEAFKARDVPDALNTPWRFMGFHLILAMQKHCQREKKPKGHTLFVFDNQERERMRFTDLITRPPPWSDQYYDRQKKQDKLDQIIDVPYFGDSKEVVLIQVADFVAFFLRRYAEIQERLLPTKYADEQERLSGWIAEELASRSIGRQFIYPRQKRQYAHDLFYDIAPPSIRDL